MAGNSYPWSVKLKTAGRLPTPSNSIPQGPTKTKAIHGRSNP